MKSIDASSDNPQSTVTAQEQECHYTNTTILFYENIMSQHLGKRRAAGSFRQLSAAKYLTDFSSNDYLGFARSLELKDLFQKALKNYPNTFLGATGSRLLAGNNSYTEALEKEIAAFHLAQAALIFNSGYDANLGLLSCLPQRNDTILIDQLVHASIIDGARLSYAKRHAFKHNDLNDLEQKLQRSKGNIYIVVESVYSMDGDEAPLEEICVLAERYHAAVLVDEAHAIGIFGQQGRGLVVEKGLSDRVFARTITFGKALGTHGAAILGSELLRNYLINFARSFIYSTAASFTSHLATSLAYNFLRQTNNHQADIQKRIAFFKRIVATGEPLIPSRSPIQMLLIPGNQQAKDAASDLQRQGFDIRPILSPTVQAGSERLRICLHNHNTFEEIETLAHYLKKYL